MIVFNFLRVQKPKRLTMSRLSAASGPPQSGLVNNKTVTLYQTFSQLSLAKTKASAPYNNRVLSGLDSPQQEFKSPSVVPYQDYQQLAVPHGLGYSISREYPPVTFAINSLWQKT